MFLDHNETRPSIAAVSTPYFLRNRVIHDIMLGVMLKWSLIAEIR